MMYNGVAHRYYARTLGESAASSDPFANFPTVAQIKAITPTTTTMPSGVYTPTGTPPAVPPDYCSIASTDFWLGTCQECTWAGETIDFFTDSSAWQQCQIAKGQAQVQSVADNAAYYYGPDSATAQAAQETADQQKAQVPADVANVANYYRAGTVQVPGANVPGMSLPSWVWPVAIVLGGVVLLNVTR